VRFPSVKFDLSKGSVENLIKRFRSLKYFEIDQGRLLNSPGVISVRDIGTDSKVPCKIVKIKRPHVADTSYASEEFKKAELAFRRFVNRDRLFNVTEVDIILNPFLEERFKKRESELNEKNVDLNLKEKWKDDPTRLKTIETLCESVYWATDQDQNGGSNPILAWFFFTLLLIYLEGMELEKKIWIESVQKDSRSCPRKMQAGSVKHCTGRND
jgi:hypothetical protein